jgi:MoaE protein
LLPSVLFDLHIISQRLLIQIRNQWEVTRIIVQHKLGDCPISEVSVLIAVSSPHRTESLKAVEFAINELKKTVPIWKKVCNNYERTHDIELHDPSNVNLSHYSFSSPIFRKFMMEGTQSGKKMLTRILMRVFWLLTHHHIR